MPSTPPVHFTFLQPPSYSAVAILHGRKGTYWRNQTLYRSVPISRQLLVSKLPVMTDRWDGVSAVTFLAAAAPASSSLQRPHSSPSPLRRRFRVLGRGPESISRKRRPDRRTEPTQRSSGRLADQFVATGRGGLGPIRADLAAVGAAGGGKSWPFHPDAAGQHRGHLPGFT